MQDHYTFDISDCYSPEDIHEVIKASFDLPMYYGGNLDALHDVLTEINYTADIEFTGCAQASAIIGAKYIRSLKKMCGDAAKENSKLAISFKD